MTENFLCRVQTSGKVVIKVVATHDTKRYERAKREMQLFKMFHKHKRICNLINSKAVDAVKRCVCIFRFYELGTVQTLLDTDNLEFTHRPYDDATACLRFKHTVDMANDVLEGLDCMHKMNIVHRDIKPANICVELLPSGTQLRFTIIDLGAAVSIQVLVSKPVAAVPATIGFTGQFTNLVGVKLPLGTVPFMSPEQIDDDRTVDGCSDVFSVGVTMYVCLCGRYPFVQTHGIRDEKHLALKLIQAYASAAEADPLNITIDGAKPRAVDEVIAIVTKSVRKLPKERYTSAAAMKQHIESIDRCCGQRSISCTVASSIRSIVVHTALYAG